MEHRHHAVEDTKILTRLELKSSALSGCKGKGKVETVPTRDVVKGYRDPEVKLVNS